MKVQFVAIRCFDARLKSVYYLLCCKLPILGRGIFPLYICTIAMLERSLPVRTLTPVRILSYHVKIGVYSGGPKVCEPLYL